MAKPAIPQHEWSNGLHLEPLIAASFPKQAEMIRLVTWCRHCGLIQVENYSGARIHLRLSRNFSEDLCTRKI